MAVAYQEVPHDTTRPELQDNQAPKFRLLQGGQEPSAPATSPPADPIDHRVIFPYPDYNSDTYFYAPSRIEQVRFGLIDIRNTIEHRMGLNKVEPPSFETVVFGPVMRFVEGTSKGRDAKVFEFITADDAEWINDRNRMAKGKAAPLKPFPVFSALAGIDEYSLNKQKLDASSFFSKLAGRLKRSQEAVQRAVQKVNLGDSKVWEDELTASQRSALYYKKELERGDPDYRTFPRYRGVESTDEFPHGDFLSTDPSRIMAEAAVN